MSIDNPYRSPNDAAAPTNRWVQKWPLDIREVRSLHVFANHPTIRARVSAWATKSGYALMNDSGSALVFSRGSRWAVWWTSDIRRIPTTLSVALGDEQPTPVRIFLHCHGFTYSTPGDPIKLSTELDALEERLHLG